MLGRGHFVEPNQYVLTFLHPKFTVQCSKTSNGIKTNVGQKQETDPWQLLGRLLGFMIRVAKNSKTHF
jgi:hypothetical protein